VSVLETAYEQGRQAALQKHGLAQPSLKSIGIAAPTRVPGTPSTSALPSLPMPKMNTNPGPSMGQQAAKIALAAPTHAAVKSSPLLGGKPPGPVQVSANPTTPETVKSVFDVQEQNRTRINPSQKLGADICTTCRKPRHYGPCPKPQRTRPPGVPIKRAGFNFHMTGDKAVDDIPSVSSGYNSSVVQEEPGSLIKSLTNPSTERTFSRNSTAIQGTESVDTDGLVGEPDVLG